MIETNREECQKCKASGIEKACYLNGKPACEVIIKEETIMSKANLDMNIFTMEFGKMKVPTYKHLDKVYEEFNELKEAYGNYASSSFWNLNKEDTEGTRYLLCSEALDMIQAAISFTSHLIEEGLMANEDIEAWKEKLEKRKEKYLK